MRGRFELLVCLSLPILLVGCATLSREECFHADWFRLGVQDGRAGKATSQLDRHMAACAEYGVVIDQQQYLYGRDQGLQEYCQPGNVFAIGLRGESYSHVCPIEMDAMLDRYNRAAYDVHRLQDELERVDRDLVNLEEYLDDNELSGTERKKIHKRMRGLEREHYRLWDDLRFAEQYLDRLMEESRRPAGSY